MEWEVYESVGFTLEPLAAEYGLAAILEFPYSQSFIQRNIRDIAEGDRYSICRECCRSGSDGGAGGMLEVGEKIRPHKRMQRVGHASACPSILQMRVRSEDLMNGADDCVLQIATMNLSLSRPQHS